ncbi:MAG: thiamine diphosphokinase [Bacillota bacterium]
MHKKRALVFLNGEFNLSQAEILNIIDSYDSKMIIGVDGGTDILYKINIVPDVIIGDLDSVSRETLEKFKGNNAVEIIKFPTEKDKTDSELAVDFCRENDIKEILIFAALGGRIDQELGNINLLEYIADFSIDGKIIEKNLEIGVINSSKIFANNAGDLLSLIPQTDSVGSVSISGCKYNTNNEKFIRSRTRGISNKILKKKARVEVDDGILIYILKKRS